MHNDHAVGSEYERYATEAVSELIGISQRLTITPPEMLYSNEVFTANLRKCIDYLSGGSIIALAEAINVDYHTLHGWLEKKPRLVLNNYLKLTFALGKMAHKALLSPEISQAQLEEIASYVAHRFRGRKSAGHLKPSEKH